MTVVPSKMDLIPRALDIRAVLEDMSVFLFGPRMTGKSTLIRETVSDALIFDLLRYDDFVNLSNNPALIEEALRSIGDAKFVVIDEIQKVPHLLDEVHRLIESRHVRFLLTGSSARKLRRGGVNLLGGRALTIQFHPFLMRELESRFDLHRALSYGTLPAVYLSESPRRLLRSYVQEYLQMEVLAEGLTRNLPSFSNFVQTAAAANASIVNFAKLASDIQTPRTTVLGYFDVLIDTLLVFELPAWRKSIRRKAVASSKYYFFDIGVANFLQGRNRLSPRTSEYGFAFETWILHELRSWIDYRERDEDLCFWSSHSGFEVDFLIGDHTAIEVKAKRTVGENDLRSLRALREEQRCRNYICVCMESRPRIRDGIEILPYEIFLENLWHGQYDFDV